MYDYLTTTHEKGLQPITTENLEQYFRKIGIYEGDTLLVHASLSSLGYVIGGAEAVNEGIIQCISLVQCVDFSKKYYQEKMSEID